ncbi:hypothetical protein MVEN_01172800 [Mycena venus]|uniref:Uncharacterized protein n=1 Tax=Mycena venus TaxID=2733690 RepID=A0A8H6Y5L7_9AGAR|nr:hypothetical protein MVEN_01172800 [Mycena venus]
MGGSGKSNNQAQSSGRQQFPEISPGTTIVPFKDFKEHGIQRSLDPDGIERDNLGIPTLELRFKHDTDVSKTNPEQTASGVSFRPAFKVEWWQDWEKDEHLRMHGPYDYTLPPAVLLRLAASHFQKYRRFPKNVFENLWESTFKIYAGILGTIPVWKKASDLPKLEDEDDISDDDFDDAPKLKRPGRVIPREPYELYYMQQPPIVQNDEEVQALLAASRAKTGRTRGEIPR